MSLKLCFICYKEATCYSNDKIKQKYKDIVGIDLDPNSSLCYICNHMLIKMWIFKSICLERSFKDSKLFSLQAVHRFYETKSNIYTLCQVDECCKSSYNHYSYEDNENDNNDQISNEDGTNDAIDSVNTLINDEEVNDSSQNKKLILSSNVKKKKKSKKKKESMDVLSLEEQKAELERSRKKKKYIEAEFKCYNCAIPFLFKDTYQAHMMRHEESNGEYRCDICTLRFASARVLRSHAKLHSMRRVHAKHATHGTDTTEVRACPLCGAVFRMARGLQQHLKRYHQANASNRSYSCSVCGKTYSNQAAVRTHMITHIHTKFSCDQCSSVFSSPYTLTQHLKKHDPEQQCVFFCEMCNVSYTSKKSLQAHKRNSINHQQNLLECPICGRICPNRYSLSTHITRMHSTTKDYWCPRCPAKYTTRKSLMRHVRAHDAPEHHQVSVCHHCGLEFKGKSKLKRHLREVCEKQKVEEFSVYYDEGDVA